MSPVLLPLIAALAAPPSTCEIELAQQLMAQQPRQDARIQGMLDPCRAAASTDYRVDLLAGVLARDDKRLNDAVDLLSRAHAQAPSELSPMLELAVTYEFQQQPGKAKPLYLRALEIDPTSRAAQLGLARVARQQYRPEEAERIYQALLSKDPNDREARTGLAMAMLQQHRYDEARARLQLLQAAEPDDPEVRAGLTELALGWRHRLDLAVGREDVPQGASNSVAAQWTMAPNARDEFHARYQNNDREVFTQDPIDRAVTPLDSLRVGWLHRVPAQYFWEIAVEYRRHDVIQDTQRVELNVGHRLFGQVQGFAGVRRQFPSGLDNRLWHLGMSVPMSQRTYATLIAYYAQPRFGDDTMAYVADFTYERERLQLTGGVGYGSDPSNVIAHVRGVWPVSPRQAITFGFEHRSLGGEFDAIVGWRMEWQ
ncbi:tetratricopeptide repeat protein [Lysobacter sp. MMG2]|uniref:tetratricopeptide repeat protein n=1 Tax=Lysobacter sp. MMG2 TaxID=2801338 RepID=UPI001C24DC96|nr:tetratricopeptide repeat protein [Lysobacter sp. MMG2]MBU8975858.1 tetratricopeptide repeat protein [Lysobacter sp. MMG2]